MNINVYDHIFSGEAKVIGYEGECVCLKFTDGHRGWYSKGKLYRSNGPEIEFADGTKYWWHENKYIRPKTNG